jgi:hypothetical protein
LTLNDVDYDCVDHVAKKIIFVDWKNFHHDLSLLSISLVYQTMMNEDVGVVEENCHVIFAI